MGSNYIQENFLNISVTNGSGRGWWRQRCSDSGKQREATTVGDALFSLSFMKQAVKNEVLRQDSNEKFTRNILSKKIIFSNGITKENLSKKLNLPFNLGPKNFVMFLIFSDGLVLIIHQTKADF